jgi:hypothetical protein
MSRYLIAVMGVALVSVPASAQTGFEILVSHVGEQDASGSATVDLRLLNAEDKARIVTLPDRVEARLTHGKDDRTIWLERDTATPASFTVAPHGFLAARYRMPTSTIGDGGALSIPAWSDQRIALARTAAPRSSSPLRGIGRVGPARRSNCSARSFHSASGRPLGGQCVPG